MIMMKAGGFGNPYHQKGVVLVVALIFLVILTMLGLSLSGSTTSEEKIARNFRDQDVANAAAEAALRDAEMAVSGMWQWPATPVNDLQFNSSCTGGWCDKTVAAAQPVDTSDFYGSSLPGSSSVAIGAVTGSPSIQGVANQPRYLVEHLPSNLSGATCVYRITAQAQGRSSNTRVVLQEIYNPSQISGSC